MIKILLVEDTVSLLQMYSTKLKISGFGVLEAMNGEDGLQVAMTEHPELIVLDVVMPKMNGLELMKTLRRDVWGRSVPIILLTNVRPDADATLQAIMEDAPAFYLLKESTTPEDLVEKVREVLGIS